MPTEEPSRAGLTKSGSPSLRVAAFRFVSFVSTACGAVGKPSAAQMRLVRSVSMASAEASAQLLDIVRAPGAVRVGEVAGGLHRDVRAAATQPLQPARADEGGGVGARGVARDAAVIGEGERRRGEAPRGELVQRGARGHAGA